MHLFRALAIRLIGPVSFVGMLLLLSRLKGEDISGTVIVILSWAMVISTLSRIGFDQLVFQYSKNFRANNNLISDRVVSNAVFLSLFFSVIMFFISYVIYTVLGFEQVYNGNHPLLLAFIVVAITINNIAASCAQSQGNTFRSVMTFPAIFYILVTVLILLDCENSRSIAFAAMINLVFSVYFLGVNHSLSIRHLSISYLCRSRYYYALNLNKLVYDWGANYYIFAILGAPQMLLFAFGSRIASICSLPLTALNPYLLPLISHNHKNSNRNSNKILSRNVVYVTLFSQVLILSTLFVFEDYFAAYSLLDKHELRSVIVPLITAQIVNVLTGPVGSVLLMSGKARAVAIINGIMAIITLIAGVYAAYYVGVSGVAIAIASGLIVQHLIYAIMAYRWTGIIPAWDALRRLSTSRRKQKQGWSMEEHD